MVTAPSRVDVFFSYNHQDRLAVDAVARRLTERGITVFLDHWSLSGGTAWTSRVEEVLGQCRAVAVFIGTHGPGRWQQAEKDLALDRQSRDPAFPVIPVILPQGEPVSGFLSRNTWIDFRDGVDDAGIERLVAAIRGEAPGPDARADTVEICPYRGLRYFREEDAPLFFGRDAFVERLFDVVHHKKLIAVVGGSGSGKSSVVRAGLMPRLRGQKSQPTWDIVTMVPGDSPWHGLAAAFVPLIETADSRTDLLVQAGKLARAFAAGEARVRDVVTDVLARQTGTDRLLLVIDQSEELFTLTRAEEQRKKFFDEIVSAAKASPLWVVLTLRADFLKDVLAVLDEPPQETVYVKPMTTAELRQAIERPALETGLAFEDGLVERILEKVEDRPGNLPLLEFVLAQLWERRKRGVLTHQAYQDIDEVEGAIAKHADTVLGDLSPGEQAIARQVFLQLVRPVPVSDQDSDEGTETRYARTRASFAELGEEKVPVIRKLADAHLLVTGRNDATGEATVDLVHEALIEQWTTLRQWIDSDRTFLQWRQQFPTLKKVFGSGGLTGDSLREAEQWLRERPGDLSTSERTYIETSIAAKWKKERRLWVRALSLTLVAFLGFGMWMFRDELRPAPGATATASTASTARPEPPPVTLTADDRPSTLTADSRLEVYLFDIGQAASMLVVGPPPLRKTLLIDFGSPAGGVRPPNFTTSADHVLQRIREITGKDRVDYFVLSHYHTDHAGGMRGGAGIIEALSDPSNGFRVGELIHPQDAGAAYMPQSRTAFSAIERNMPGWLASGRVGRSSKPAFGTSQINLGPGVTVEVLAFGGTTPGGSAFEKALNAGADYAAGPANENDLSIALEITAGEFEMFTAGDLTGTDVERRNPLFVQRSSGPGRRDTLTNVQGHMVDEWASTGRESDVEIYCAGHGATYSIAPKLLAALDPEFVLYSMSTYERSKETVFRRVAETARQFATTAVADGIAFAAARGTIAGEIRIVVAQDGNSYTIEGEKHRAFTSAAEAAGEDRGEEDRRR